MKRRAILSMLPAAALPVAAMCSPRIPMPKPQPQSDFKGVVNAGDYPTLQAAADAAFGTLASPHGTANNLLNKELVIPNERIWMPPFSGAPVLDLRYLHGGVIRGVGQFATRLRQNVAGVPVIRTNGCGYSVFENFLLEGSPESAVLDLNWDGTAGGPALQSNKFRNILFLNGSFGVNIATGGFMGSENSFTDCYWQSQTVAGFMNSGFNALQQSIRGGNFQNCARAIWVAVGSVNVIDGVGFQLSQDCDILTSGSANNAMHVKGCRTESTNFIHNDGSHALTVESCDQWGSAPGDFVTSSGGLATLKSVYSKTGRCKASAWAEFSIENGNFHRTDFMDASGLGDFGSYKGLVDLRNVFYDEAGGWKQVRAQRWEPTSSGIQKSEAVFQVL